MMVSRKVVWMVGFVLLWGMGCASDEEKKAEHLKKGQGYFESGEFKSADIEFKNAVQLDPKSVDGYIHLGRTAMKLGQAREAFNAFMNASKLDPDNIEANLQLSKFYLLAKKPEDARKAVDKVLAKEHDNVEALLVSANLSMTLDKLSEAEAIFDKVIKKNPQDTRAYTGLAALHIKQNRFYEAETILKKAVSIDPKSITPRMTLVGILISSKKFDQAETELRQIIDNNPQNSDLRITLADFFLGRKKFDEAEQTLNKAIEIDSKNMKAYMAKARYFLLTDKKDQVPAVYNQALKAKPDDESIMNLLARYYYDEKDIETAEKTNDRIFQNRPEYAPALMLKGEIQLNRKKFDEAIALFEKVTKDNPNSERGHYFTALAYAGKGETASARNSLVKCIEINPGFHKARLLLAEIYYREKSFDLAEKEVNGVYHELRDDFHANLLAGNISLAQKDLAGARKSFEKLVALQPKNPEGHFRMGILHRLNTRNDLALKSFEKALALEPDRVDVFTHLVLIDIAMKNYAKAISRCDSHLALFKNAPKGQSMILDLKGGVYVAQKDLAKAEEAFKASIEKNPESMRAYLALARIYLAEKRQDKAIDQYKKIIAKNPKQVGAHMMLGMIYEFEKKNDLSEEQYRKALAINPDFIPAANNLAYMLAEQGRNLDEALGLAKKAKEKAPDEPNVMDTLGWVYYKKGLYESAISELQDCLEKMPDNPTVYYHLGLAYYKNGNIEKSRAQLEKSLKISKDFPEAEDAKKMLSTL